MDYHFWLTLLVSVIYVWLLHKQNKILEKTGNIAGTLPAERESGKRKVFPRYWPLVLMGLLFLLTWVPYVLSPKYPVTTLQFHVTPHFHPSEAGKQTPFISGQPAKFNVSFDNQGPKGAFDTAMKGNVKLLRGPASQRDEDDAWTAFENSTVWSGKTDVASGDGPWHTYQTPDLTEADIQDIHNGRLLLYIMAEGKFRDENGEHPVERCNLLTTPWR